MASDTTASNSPARSGVTLSATAANEKSYLPVSVDTLEPADALPFSLYLLRRDGPLLFAGQGLPLSLDELQRVRNSQVTVLYVPYADRMAYESHLEQLYQHCAQLEPRQAVQVLKAKTRTILGETMSDAQLGRSVAESSNLAAHLVDVVAANALTSDDLFSLMAHDYGTYTHVLNVCVYSVSLGRALGISAEAELVALAQGALLHDIGKRHIPQALLNKTSQLTERERALMQEHPRYGFIDVCTGHDLSWAQLMMIYQHHERPDGRGYPVRITENEIHAWGRLCAVADVYDALTAPRAYRRPASRLEALQHLNERAGTQFDREMVTCFQQMMSP